MQGKTYTKEQIVAVLKEAEAEARLPELCRKYGMSEATCYNWKAKYPGMTASDMKRLKALEEENPDTADVTIDAMGDDLDRFKAFPLGGGA
jgi:putative transposase